MGHPIFTQKSLCKSIFYIVIISLIFVNCKSQKISYGEDSWLIKKIKIVKDENLERKGYKMVVITIKPLTNKELPNSWPDLIDKDETGMIVITPNEVKKHFNLANEMTEIIIEYIVPKESKGFSLDYSDGDNVELKK